LAVIYLIFNVWLTKKRAKPCAEHRATVAKIPAITRVIRGVAGAKI